MAASSPSVTPGSPGVIGKYTLICELGGRSPATFAAHTSASGALEQPRLVIVERLLRGSLSASEIDAFSRTARRLALVKNPSFIAIREVLVTPELVAIVSEFSEGETFSELNLPVEGKKRFELTVMLKILVDVLDGLGAIHGAPELEKATEPKTIVHAEVTPANVLVGLDGRARIVRPHRLPRRGTILPEHVKALLGYVAPETLVGDGPDPRADLYGVGVMLWEAISGERLFTQDTPAAALTLQLSGELPRAKLPEDAPWAEPLVNIAARALQVSPERRFSTAKDFADAIRRAVEGKLAPTLQVAAAVSARAGAKIETRRLRLKPPQPAASAATIKMSAPKASAPRPTKSTPPTAPTPPPVVKAGVKAKANEAQAEEVDWDDVVEAKAPARSMPPPVPSRAPSRAPSQPPPAVHVAPLMIQPPLPTIIAIDALVAPIVRSTPALVETLDPELVVDPPDITPDIAPSIPPSTRDDTTPMRVLRQKNPRVAIVAGLIALCVVILLVAGIRAAVRPKDEDSFAKKSPPASAAEAPAPPPPAVAPATAVASIVPPEPPPVVAAAVPDPPPPEPAPTPVEPPPVVAKHVDQPPVAAPPRAPSAPLTAGKPAPRPAAPKVAKPRPKTNYEPQGI